MNNYVNFDGNNNTFPNHNLDHDKTQSDGPLTVSGDHNVEIFVYISAFLLYS